MVLSPQIQTPQYKDVLDAFETGSITDADRKMLQTYIIAISQHVTSNDGVQARDIVQALTINHLILQRHIDGLERRSSRTQALVIALTIASLVGTAAQCWLAYKADERSETEAVARAALSTTLSEAARTQASKSTANLPAAANPPVQLTPANPNRVTTK